MQKIFFPLLLGASIALLAIWAFDKPRQTAAILPVREKENHPQDYFLSPVSGPIHPTGTCGELRPDHFHTGLDIDGKTGDPVFAAADGHIETIKVQSSGYGNILYVRHPNGYTTCYAHLDRFTSDIQAFVKKNQYERERFAIELKPPDAMFQVRKGQQIGYLGNSGGSTGPHLHFEIRSPSGKAVNPLICGIPLADNLAPDIRDMKVYFLNDHREVLGSKAFPIHKDKKGNIRLEGQTVFIGGSRIGFGVKAYDRCTAFRNDNGLYSVALFADDKLAFKWTADEFDFDDQRYLNAHIDYAARQRFGSWFHRCFVLPGDFLGNYTRTETMGAISLSTARPTKITLKVSDAAGNTSTINFWAQRDQATMESFVSPPYQFLMPYDAENHIDLDGFSIAFPKGTLYETLQLQYGTTQDGSSGIYSSIHQLHDTQTPLHKSFGIKIKPAQLPVELRPKAVIANRNEGKPDNCGGVWQGEWLTTNTRTFGDFCVMADTVAPGIAPLVFAADMRGKNTMAFRILDNFAVSGTAENLTYRGTIDGQWVLFEFDKKRNRLTYEFDEHVGAGEHIVRISAKDDRGNQGVFEGKFLR